MFTSATGATRSVASSSTSSGLRRGATGSMLRPSRPLLSNNVNGKEITKGVDARYIMLRGWEKLFRAVSCTLGPKGRNVVIEQTYGSPKITKDGVTVAQAINLADRIENCGAQLAKEVSARTNDLAGDGTTTACVLGYYIYREGCKAVAAGMNPMDVKRGIEKAVAKVLEELPKMSIPIDEKDVDAIRNVATIAANSDKTIGNIIATAFEKVGTQGTITVSQGQKLEHELEVVEGCRFDKGYISPYFCDANSSGASQAAAASGTFGGGNKIELENPLVLCYEKKLSTIQQVLPLLEKYAMHLQTLGQSGGKPRPLLIIAEDVDGEALSALVLNKIRGGLNVCAVKAPGFGENRSKQLEDFAVLTGGVVVTDAQSVSGGAVADIMLVQGTGITTLETLDAAKDLGTAKRVIISKNDTTIFEGAGQSAGSEAIKERVEVLKGDLERETSEYQKDKLKERIGKLTSGVAIIKVGGASEVEVNEVKDRIEDALCATRCAVEEGIVPGGGVALLYAGHNALASKSKEEISKDLGLANFDQEIGMSIVKTALKKPCVTIVNNANGVSEVGGSEGGMSGVSGDSAEGAVVVETLLNKYKAAADKAKGINEGFNAQTGEYTDMMASGIIDTTKVIRTALADAASVASLLTTSEVVISDYIEEPQWGRDGLNPYQRAGRQQDVGKFANMRRQ